MANTLKLGNGKWATGKDTVLAFNDENNNIKPLPFNFSRASSATVVNQSGLIETVQSGTPRIDFLGNTKGALKLEPTRTNSINYSEKVLLWSISGTVVRQDNVSISPDGKQTASTIAVGNDTSFNRIRQNFSVSANSTCTASLFIKKVQTETNYLGVGVVFSGGTTDVAYVSFDSVNGIARNMDSRITAILNVVDYGTYWRLESTATDSGSNTQLEMSVYPTLSTDGINVAPGAGSVRTIWGMQLESNSSYATSYIPTSGQSGGVTRVAETSSQTVPDGVIGQTEGTVFAQINISSIESVGGFSAFRIYDGTTSNAISFIIYPTGRIQSTAFNSGSLVANINDNDYGLTSGVHKIAFAYKLNDYILYVDGLLVGTDTSATVPTTNKFDLSYTNVGSHNYNQTKLYNTRLSNAELASLTTI